VGVGLYWGWIELEDVGIFRTLDIGLGCMMCVSEWLLRGIE
jgi:hypothetical protein